MQERYPVEMEGSVDCGGGVKVFHVNYRYRYIIAGLTRGIPIPRIYTYTFNSRIARPLRLIERQPPSSWITMAMPRWLSEIESHVITKCVREYR